MENADHGTQERDGAGGQSGRPQIEFDLRQLENLGAISATQPELAAWFRVSLSTIEKHLGDGDTRYDYEGKSLTFREIYEMGTGRGKASLRRVQMDAALGGNATMMIWLGKQLLGQRDNLDTALSGPSGGAIEINATISARELLAHRVASISERLRAGEIS